MENKKRHPKMPVEKRAKQFMPFAAVTGLEKALAEKEKEMEKDFRMDIGWRLCRHESNR